MGWPILMVDGVEADDVIGTLAVQATARGMKTVVSTGDKDLAQLVNDKVMLINTMSNEKLDEAGVLAKFGVPPNRIIDYLTLIGDTVDNVPGVAKCGPKTAVKWLTLHDSLDGVMENAGSIGGAVGENLRAALDWLPKGRELITVKTDCDLVEHMVSIAETLVARPEDARQRCATSSAATASRRCCANWAARNRATAACARQPAARRAAVRSIRRKARRPRSMACRSSRASTKPCSPTRSWTPGWR